MQVENIARIGLAAGRTLQNQGHFPIGHRLLGKVVVHHQGTAAGIAEILADGGPGKGSVILHGRGIGGRCGHHHRVVHRTLGAQGLHDVRHRGTFLSHRHIDAIDRLAGQESLPLVDNGVDGDGGLSRLAVADNQFALAAPDGNHRVNGFDACLKRFIHGLAENDARGLALQGHLRFLALDGAESVQRIAERIHHAAEHLLAHVDGRDAAGTAHRHALLDQVGRTQQDGAHVVLFQVHHHGHDPVAAVKQFARLGMRKPVQADYTIAHLQDLADFFPLEGGVHLAQLLQQHLGNFTGFDILSHIFLF